MFNAEVIADMECEHLLSMNLLPDSNPDYMYENFGCETNMVMTSNLFEILLPVYFEHKIANAFGTYQFIKEIVEIQPSRTIIDKITQEDIKNFIKSFASA